MSPALQVDHLVVAADTLAQGERWCEATFGVRPDAGGQHAWMGTHNRLLSLTGGAFTQAYLEIIAIDPDAPPPGRARWFGLDEPALRERVRESPLLVHWVLSCTDIAARRAELQQAGVDPGEVCDAERQTARGRLQWRITVRPDGRPVCGGALPTLIEWQPGLHPAQQLPDRGLRLQSLTVALGDDPARRTAWTPWPVPGVLWQDADTPALRARFDTPRGPVTLTAC